LAGLASHKDLPWSESCSRKREVEFARPIHRFKLSRAISDLDKDRVSNVCRSSWRLEPRKPSQINKDWAPCNCSVLHIPKLFRGRGETRPGFAEQQSLSCCPLIASKRKKDNCNLPSLSSGRTFKDPAAKGDISETRSSAYKQPSVLQQVFHH
jgi:hypothetical protein